jgi:two-component system, cell cycle response regulator DivK
MSGVPVPSPSLGALILIADDSEDIRELYGEYLRLCGFQTEVATGGEEAVAKARQLRPAAVVMDLSMPSVDGIEATRRLKAEEATRDIPVIALTGHAAQHSKESALKAGCATYLTKPCLPEALTAVVRRVLRQD